MINIDKLCMGCMKLKPDMGGVCPYCGYDSLSQGNELWQLPPRSILNGRYLTGKVLGEGGFGIVYLGYDLSMEIVVAIKEMFPSGMMTRDFSVNPELTEVTVLKDPEVIKSMKEKFLLEVRSVARLQNLDGEGLVHVLNLFEENGTAYMVMEYLEGHSLKDYLKIKNRISWEETIALLRPIMIGIKNIHNAHLIHRDISPDNIMLLKNGGAKLMDFGGIKDVLKGMDQQHTIMITVKSGYSPIEQYQTKGKIGPWTDIYSFCATVYRALTGRRPVDTALSQAGEKLVAPSQLGCSIPIECETMLMRGLDTDYSLRPQSMDELINVFGKCESKEEKKQGNSSAVPADDIKANSAQPVQEKSSASSVPPFRVIAAASVAAASLAVVVIFGIHTIGLRSDRFRKASVKQIAVQESTELTEPVPVMLRTEQTDKIIILDDPEQTEIVTEVLSSAAVKRVPETIAKRVPEATVETVQETTAETVQETTAKRVQETTAEIVWEAAAERVQDTAAETVPETIVETVREAAAERVQDTAVETVPETTMEIVQETTVETVTETSPITESVTVMDNTEQNRAAEPAPGPVIDIVAQSANQTPAAATTQNSIPSNSILQIPAEQMPETQDTRIQYTDFFQDGRITYQNDEILPGSKDHILTEEELSQLTQKGLCYAKNEIYARYGRGFNSRELTEYFEQQDWYEKKYEPLEHDNEICSMMTSFENHNKDILSAAETKLGNGEQFRLDQ